MFSLTRRGKSGINKSDCWPSFESWQSDSNNTHQHSLSYLNFGWALDTTRVNKHSRRVAYPLSNISWYLLDVFFYLTFLCLNWEKLPCNKASSKDKIIKWFISVKKHLLSIYCAKYYARFWKLHRLI